MYHIMIYSLVVSVYLVSFLFSRANFFVIFPIWVVSYVFDEMPNEVLVFNLKNSWASVRILQIPSWVSNEWSMRDFDDNHCNNWLALISFIFFNYFNLLFNRKKSRIFVQQEEAQVFFLLSLSLCYFLFNCKIFCTTGLTNSISP